MNIGYRIREARIRQQLTQKDVVGEYMTRNMLSKIENGSATPSVKSLEYLAGALSLPVSYFVGEGSEAEPQVQSVYMRGIGELADALLSENSLPCYNKALALCVKALTLLAGNDAGTARELLNGCGIENFDIKGQKQLYVTLEETCKAQNDYKQAYECACRRMALE